MSFSPTGTSGAFTVNGTPHAFEVDETVNLVTAGDGAVHHIPFGNTVYIQSAGPGASRFMIPAYFYTMSDFLALEAVTGWIGQLWTIVRGVWQVARLDQCEQVYVWPEANLPVDARLTFTAAQQSAPGQQSP